MSPEPIGQFRLGFSEVVAPNPQKLLESRNATEEEWVRLVDEAVEERFSRFDGDRLFHLGIVVDAYSLPPAMIPGRSALAVRVTVWEDATQAKLNSEPNMISVVRVFEEARDLERTEEMALLAEDLARALEDWLRSRQREAGWFGTSSDPAASTEEPALPTGDNADAG